MNKLEAILTSQVSTVETIQIKPPENLADDVHHKQHLHKYMNFTYHSTSFASLQLLQDMIANSIQAQ